MSAGIAAAAAAIGSARAAQSAPPGDQTRLSQASQPPQRRTAGAAAADSGPRGGSPTLGVALGSGSVHGLAHLGVLRVLRSEGLRPGVIAGTSAGAIIGALWAAGMEQDAIESTALDLDWQGIGSLTWPTRGLMTNAPLQRRIEQAVGERRLEALPVPFGAVATDVLDGSRVLLRKGRVGLAVGASSSIPVLFEPVRVDGLDLFDGSLTEPVPVDSAREMGADFVVAVDVAYRPNDARPKGVTDMAFQMMHIMINALINEQIGRAEFIVRIELHHLMHRGWTPQTLIDEGARAMRAAWPALSERLRQAGFRQPRR
jgi:NTE family protein